MLYLHKFFLTMGLALLPITLVAADNPTGLSIAKLVKQQQSGFVGYTAQMKMILKSGNHERVRILRLKTREIKDDGEQSLAIFDSPADVKGTVFLIHSHIHKDDSQWIYLPSLKRVKRIAARNKTSPFMGSEFTYEDLASQEVEKFTYQYAGETTLNGQENFVVERFPRYSHSGYKKQIIWVEKERNLITKTEYYDKRGKLKKTLVASDFKLYKNRFWRPHHMKMHNHQSEKTSILKWENYDFNIVLKPQDFARTAMSRQR